MLNFGSFILVACVKAVHAVAVCVQCTWWLCGGPTVHANSKNTYAVMHAVTCLFWNTFPYCHILAPCTESSLTV